MHITEIIVALAIVALFVLVLRQVGKYAEKGTLRMRIKRMAKATQDAHYSSWASWAKEELYAEKFRILHLAAIDYLPANEREEAWKRGRICFEH